MEFSAEQMVPGSLREPRAEMQKEFEGKLIVQTRRALNAMPRSSAFILLAAGFQHLAQENLYFQIEFNLLPHCVKWQIWSQPGWNWVVFPRFLPSGVVKPQPENHWQPWTSVSGGALWGPRGGWLGRWLEGGEWSWENVMFVQGRDEEEAPKLGQWQKAWESKNLDCWGRIPRTCSPVGCGAWEWEEGGTWVWFWLCI